MLRIISTITEDYLPLAMPWLDSVSVVTSATIHCVTYKWDIPPALKKQYHFIDFRHMPAVASESFGMIQHGRFLDAFDFPQNDVICLTDTDIVVNRDFNRDELTLYMDNSFGTHWISAGYNGGPDDTLGDEAGRIAYKPAVKNDFDKPLFNCGVMVGPAISFRRVQVEYEKDYADFYAQCGHRSRCQFQFWRAWHRMPGPKLFLPMPGVTHQHGHFGEPRIIDRSRVMFLHKL